MGILQRIFRKKKHRYIDNCPNKHTEETTVEPSLSEENKIDADLKTSEASVSVNSSQTIVEKECYGEYSYVEDNTAKLPDSITELNQSELILLKELHYTRIESKNEIKMQSYFKYEYGMNPDDAPAYLELFLKFGLLEPLDLLTTIQKHSIPQIKEVLLTKSISLKGRKNDQIQALFSNFTEEELNALFPSEYYVLSESGKQLLDEQLDPDDWENRYKNIDFETAKKDIETLIASKAHAKTILYINNPFHNIPEYVLNNHEIFICTVMYAKGWKIAKRILKRVFKIEDPQFYVEKYSAVLRSEKELCESKEADALLKKRISRTLSNLFYGR